MNVGIVTTWYERGAAYVSKAFRAALESTNNVFIYARGGHYYARGDSQWDQKGVTWAPRLYRARINITHFTRWLKRYDIDTLIFNEQKDIHPVKTVKKLGYIVGSYIDYYKRDNIEDFLIYDFLICNTMRHYDVFKWHPQCFFIPWGTDTELFKPMEKTNLLTGAPVFFHSAGFGGVNLRKGTDLVVRAFQKVKGNVRLIIHSQSPLKKYASVSQLIQSDPRIEFIYKTVRPPGLYNLGDIYVYPSRLEGIGLSVCEALSCGLPAIVTDSLPMSEFVQHEFNGLLVKVANTKPRFDGYYWPETIVDVNDLAKKMQYYIDNPQERIKHSKQARKNATEKLCWRRNASNLPKQLKSISRPRNRVRAAPLFQQIHWGVMDISYTIFTFGFNILRYAKHKYFVK